MMSLGTAVVVLPASLTGVIAALIFYGSWQRQRVDVARKELFIARDELFILFATSPLTVDHPCHRMLRRDLNRMIRYAHRVTWLRIVLYVYISPTKRSTKLRQAVSMIYDQDMQQAVRSQIARAYDAVVGLMITRSAPLLLLRLLVLALTTARKKWHEWRMNVEIAADTIVAVAEQEHIAAEARAAARAKA